MCFKVAVLFLVCVSSLAAQRIQEKRQIHPISIKGDHVPAETGFASAPAAAHHGSKFFQDIYVAMEKPKQLEFGHVRETPKDWEQRFEKINLENLNRQGKVRWGDKHGGYGEHYWDYNHAGHGHDGDGEESQQQEEYAAYEDESKNLPVVASVDSQRGKRQHDTLKDVEFVNDRARSLILSDDTQKHGGNYRTEKDFRGKRQDSDVEFINDKARSLILNGRGQKHGGNYKRANDFRGKREPTISGEHLSFDPQLGIVVDGNTGRTYRLKPIDFLN